MLNFKNIMLRSYFDEEVGVVDSMMILVWRQSCDAIMAGTV
jgi:hypothetical protein